MNRGFRPRHSARRSLAGVTIGLLIVLAACSSDVGVPQASIAASSQPQVNDAAATPSSPVTEAASDSVPATEAESAEVDTEPHVVDTIPEVVHTGPVADVSQALSGGNGVFIGSGNLAPIEAYTELEYVASGEATTYRPDGELTPDGMWTFVPTTTAPYRTRALVRAPRDPDDFSGTVIVEWLNVSGGVDADPDFAMTREEIVRSGHVWVGVSAQAIGVEGGPVAVKVDTPGTADIVGKGLKAIDPARYGSLTHPGDAFAYDIFSQVGRAARTAAFLYPGVLPAHVVAMGESQSAFALVTYINGVQPLSRVFDGFFVHSRGAAGLPVPEPGKPADISSSLAGVKTTLRVDSNAPTFVLQTESDVAGIFNSISVRQPDTDIYRLWEVAGTAHADAHLLGANAANMNCGLPVNDGPMHVVTKAALRHLVTWVSDGTAPPTAAPLESDATGLMRDSDGIVRGGVRTPPVDVPTRGLSSVPGPVPSVICLLLGSTKPLPAERLAALYPTRADFEQRFDDAAERAVESGYVLSDDLAALREYAHPELISSG